MTKYPEPVVGGYIRNSKGEILLIKSPKWGDYWLVAGGHIEWGESIEKAITREIKEELGIKVEYTNLICTFEDIFPTDYYKKSHMIYLQCECMVKPKQIIKTDPSEVSEAKWFSLENALKLDLHKKVRKVIEMLLNRE
jgi:nucleoside triphosphatase